MGVTGPLKLPAHLRAVDDRDAHSVADVTPPSAPPKPYAVARDTELSALWDTVVAQLDEANLLAACDGLTLELALRHFLAARQASVALDGEPVVFWNGKYNVRHPAGDALRYQSDQFLRYASQLGMSFAARSRMNVDSSASRDANPFLASG